MPFENAAVISAAKIRLENFLRLNKEGSVGAVADVNLLMKSGYVILFRVDFLTL